MYGSPRRGPSTVRRKLFASEPASPGASTSSEAPPDAQVFSTPQRNWASPQNRPDTSNYDQQRPDQEHQFSSQPIPAQKISSARTMVRFKTPLEEGGRAVPLVQRREIMSPMRRLDAAVRAELKRRREDSKLPEEPSLPVIAPGPEKKVTSRILPTQASGSAIEDLERELGPLQMNSALAAAVDCLLKAEQAYYFRGAVRAAEAAADAVPPEMAEEAAAAGARGYKAEVVDSVHETWEGPKPMEVVGYIGVTKPH